MPQPPWAKSLSRIVPWGSCELERVLSSSACDLSFTTLLKQWALRNINNLHVRDGHFQVELGA